MSKRDCTVIALVGTALSAIIATPAPAAASLLVASSGALLRKRKPAGDRYPPFLKQL